MSFITPPCHLRVVSNLLRLSTGANVGAARTFVRIFLILATLQKFGTARAVLRRIVDAGFDDPSGTTSTSLQAVLALLPGRNGWAAKAETKALHPWLTKKRSVLPLLLVVPFLLITADEGGARQRHHHEDRRATTAGGWTIKTPSSAVAKRPSAIRT